jgi:hypothetical protein
VVLAQHRAVAGQGVLVEGSSRLVVTQCGQGESEVVSRCEGVEVVPVPTNERLSGNRRNSDVCDKPPTGRQMITRHKR